MPILADRVRDVTSTTGTGAFALAGTPPTSYQAFGTALPNGAPSVPYCCVDSSTGAWEVGKGAFSNIGDGSWASVKTLLQFDGTNGSTTITDVSPTPLTWTNVANGVTLNTSTFKYGTASAYFSGASTGLTGDGSAAFAFGSGDWTVEMWIKPTAALTMMGLYNDQISSGADTTRKSLYINSTGQVIYVTGATTQITGGTTIPTTSFTHIAVSRVSGVTRLFINGVQEGSNFTDSTVYTVGAARPVLGNDSPISATWAFVGYMDDVRVTKGVGRYSTTFTPAPCGVAGGALSRDVIRASSNAGAAVSFAAGSKDIFLTANAELVDNANIGLQVAQARGQALP